MTRLANLLSKLQHGMEHRLTRPVGKRVLGILAIVVLVATSSYSVTARPWGDHQHEAQAIVRAAACAGVSKMLQGDGEYWVKAETVATAAHRGFRKAHGREIWVNPVQIRHRPHGPAFAVKVAMTYQRPHFLFEALTGNDSPWATEVAVIDDSNFRTCPGVMSWVGDSMA